jgi:hypothetical protein
MTLCSTCKKPLKECKELHAVEGLLFCSKACAVSHISADIILNIEELAKEAYNETAEVVLAEDIIADELYMTSSDILELIRSLAKAQGFYTRLHTVLMEMSEATRDELLSCLEEQKFKDATELILYLEEG